MKHERKLAPSSHLFDAEFHFTAYLEFRKDVARDDGVDRDDDHEEEEGVDDLGVVK
jgi:hypothetical protein